MKSSEMTDTRKAETTTHAMVPDIDNEERSLGAVYAHFLHINFPLASKTADR